MAPIERITLFKIPNEADQDRLLEQYKILAKTATKVCVQSIYPVLLSRNRAMYGPLRFNSLPVRFAYMFTYLDSCCFRIEIEQHLISSKKNQLKTDIKLSI
jgi:hypothetical protein